MQSRLKDKKIEVNCKIVGGNDSISAFEAWEGPYSSKDEMYNDLRNKSPIFYNDKGEIDAEKYLTEELRINFLVEMSFEELWRIDFHKSPLSRDLWNPENKKLKEVCKVI